MQCISQDLYLIGLKKVIRGTAGVRRLCSTALDLAYIGAGRLDGYFEDRLSYYDIAAGKLIAREASVIVKNAERDDTREGAVVAAPPHIHEWLMDMFGLGTAVVD